MRTSRWGVECQCVRERVPLRAALVQCWVVCVVSGRCTARDSLEMRPGISYIGTDSSDKPCAYLYFVAPHPKLNLDPRQCVRCCNLRGPNSRPHPPIHPRRDPISQAATPCLENMGRLSVFQFLVANLLDGCRSCQGPLGLDPSRVTTRPDFTSTTPTPRTRQVFVLQKTCTSPGRGGEALT